MSFGDYHPSTEYVSSTTAEVAAKVQAESTLVTATGGSTGTAAPVSQTNLSGGSE